MFRQIVKVWVDVPPNCVKERRLHNNYSPKTYTHRSYGVLPMRRPVDYLSLLLIASITLCALPSLADDNPFDCHVTAESHSFDLTPLAGEHTINRTRQTPPSEMIDSLRFNLCQDLEILEHVPQKDQVRP